MAGAVLMTLVLITIAGVTVYLVGSLVRTINRERQNARMKMWKNFGLSLAFCTLFFTTWVAHGIAEWQVFTDEQAEHNEPTEIGDFLAQFSQSTLENWQSEFLQLFSFTVLAALLIHKGSAESRDSEDLMQSALKRIEDKLGTEVTLGDEIRQDSSLHVVPDDAQGWMLRDGTSPSPIGYYDNQDDAIKAGRDAARQKNVDLVIHRPDATIRSS